MARILSSLAWSTAFRLIGVGSAFLINVVLARLLAPEDLGQYLIAFSLAMFVAIFMRFGVKQATMRLAAEARNRGDAAHLRSTLNGIFRYALLTVSVVSAALLLGVGEWVFVEFFSARQLADANVWFVIWAAAIAFAAPVGEALRALHRPGWGVALDMSAQSAVVLLVTAGLLLSGTSISVSAILIIWCVVSWGVVAAGFLRLNLLVPSRPSDEAARIPMKGVFHAAWPILILNMSTFLTANAALWVVGSVLGHQDAALYGVAVKIFNLLALPLLIINLALEPHIADYLHKRKHDVLEALLRLSAMAAFLLTVSITVVLVAFGEWVLTFGFGDFYSGAYLVLLALLAGNLVNVLTGSCASVLLLAGAQKWLALINAIAAVIGVSLAFLLVPRMGILGAGVATVVAVALANTAMWATVRARFRLNTAVSLAWKSHYAMLKPRVNSQ